MPLARIDLNKRASPELVRTVCDAVYSAMVEIANVPLHDRFQIVTRHEDDEILYPPQGYLGVHYSSDVIIIQITWVAGRSTDVKQMFFQRVVDRLHDEQGIRREDIVISLVDNNREDWSFGNGIMQYAPKEG